jgi:hypothetical protein
VAGAVPPPLARQFIGEIPFVGMSDAGTGKVMVGGGIGESGAFTPMRRVGGRWKIDLSEMIGGEPLTGEAAALRATAAKMRRIADEIAGGQAKSQVEYLRELSATKK